MKNSGQDLPGTEPTASPLASAAAVRPLQNAGLLAFPELFVYRASHSAIPPHLVRRHYSFATSVLDLGLLPAQLPSDAETAPISLLCERTHWPTPPSYGGDVFFRS